MRALSYLRVSTDDQTTDNQRPDVERLASARGLTVAKWYADDGVSGMKARRPALDALVREARSGDTVIVWRLDRLGRSMLNTLGLVRELDERGVRLLSVGEPWLDNAGPMRSLLLGIFTWFAEYERSTIVERTRAGLKRATDEGVTLGRPRVPLATLQEVARLVAGGATVGAACETGGVSTATFRRWRAGQ